MERTSAKVGKDKQAETNADFSLDRALEKQQKGRPRKCPPDWVRGTADNYRYVFGLLWSHIWPGLSKAQTQQEVIQVISRKEVSSYALDLIPKADLMLQVVRDPKFPKRKREAQINFMADSLGGYGLVAPRSSRDICAKERARIKRIHHIIRYEFYVECSCGYKGISRNHACARCEAKIPLSYDLLSEDDTEP